MAEKNERLGLLLLFDCIAVILSTFGVLFLSQIVNHESDVNLMIISCFFVGIKILLMGIGDITGLAKKIGVACIFILAADIIVFGINFLMAFGISKGLIGITLIADIIIILISHLIWGKIFGNAQNDTKERKAWLNNKDEEETSEDEYDDIFASLVTKDGNTDEIDTVAVNHAVRPDTDNHDDDFDYESEEDDLYEDDYDDDDFVDYEEDELDDYDNDDEDDVASEALFDDEEDTYLDEEAFKNLLINPADLNKIDQEDESELEIVEESIEVEVEESVVEIAESDETEEQKPVVIEEPDEDPMDIPSVDEILAVVDNKQLEDKTLDSLDKDTENKENLTEIEERLGVLLSDINNSTQNTKHLEKSVSAFRKELDHLIPITTDTDILKTGDVIRDKLKTIIDKQFIVDEVLDDLIRLSKQINKRIDDLDEIEADLNKRREVLDQKELMFMHKKPVDFEDIEMQILPDELVLEDDDSEIIIDQGDWETIRAYLKEHPEA